jgi:hypothetical protein
LDGDGANDVNARGGVRSKRLNGAVERSCAPAHGRPLQWLLTAHCCRRCGGGRILAGAGDAPGDGGHYLCTNCEAEHIGAGPEGLCFCGLRVKRHGPKGGELDPGVRCHENPSPSPEFPSKIIASEQAQ